MKIIQWKVSFLFLIVSTALFQSEAQAGGVENSTQAIQNALQSNGFSTAPGKPFLFGLESCANIVPVFGNCFGNNPAAPYVMFGVPKSTSEYTDPYYGLVMSHPNDSHARATFRMQPSEAFVITMKTPPLGAYYGVQTYLFSREGQSIPPQWLTSFDEGLATLLYGQTPNPARFNLFAALGASNNNLSVSEKMGSAFERLIHIIIAADERTADTVKNAIKSTGVAENAIFLEEIPSEVKLGLGPSADDLLILMRYALPKVETAGNAWRAELPISILRASSTVPSAVQRFEAITPPQRSGNDETILRTALNQLITQIQIRLQIPNDSKQEFPLIPMNRFGLNGPICIEKKMNCLGDTYDTDTYRVGMGKTLANNEVIAVAGVNHTLTGNATYVSLSVNEIDTLTGVDSVSQTGQSAGFFQGALTGSATQFLQQTRGAIPPALKSQSDKLYVRLFARNCQGLPLCQQIPVNTIGLNSILNITQRAYIRPGTKAGADPTKLLTPSSIQWRR